MRLLTRSDFDGLACGALLKSIGLIDSVRFVHPKDIQDGLVEAGENDVLANIPYIPGCKLWFDHHISERERLGDIQFEGESRIAPSCARVIYDYYGGAGKFPQFDRMIGAVDKVDSADLTLEEIKNPSGWILLGFIMDPRTGLGRFRDFRISNYDLMLLLMDACAAMEIDQILELPDVAERINTYNDQTAKFIEMVAAYSRVEGDAVVTDLRGVETIYTGNRFMIYSLFPEQNINLWIVDGRGKQNCPIAVGHSILNRTSKVRVGSLLLKYGGGGHDQVGTCQPMYEQADWVIREILEVINGG
ncbi:MAG: exopolyphosphatase [Oscillospiraceae bacterium]|nr:exopolyphosphatase [Oscillospiraceae bacterium]